MSSRFGVTRFFASSSLVGMSLVENIVDIRDAEVRFSPVLPPHGENLELDLNLAGYLVENCEPEPQNRFYQVRSAVRAGSDLKKSFKFL